MATNLRALASTRSSPGCLPPCLLTQAAAPAQAPSSMCDIEKGRRAVSVQRAAAWARKLGYLEAQYVALALQAEA